MMKKYFIFLIIGIIIGVGVTLVYDKFDQKEELNSNEKKDAIIFAQNTIIKNFERNIDVENKNNPNYPKFQFPPISLTKIVPTEFDSYVIRVYVEYPNERCVKYANEENYCTKRAGDNFYVEIEKENELWSEVDIRRYK
jgi:hypothetical protein